MSLGSFPGSTAIALITFAVLLLILGTKGIALYVALISPNQKVLSLYKDRLIGSEIASSEKPFVAQQVNTDYEVRSENAMCVNHSELDKPLLSKKTGGADFTP